MRVHSIIGALSAASIITAACGGGGSSETTAAPEPIVSDAPTPTEPVSAPPDPTVPQPAETLAPALTMPPAPTDPPTTPLPEFVPVALKPEQVFNFSGIHFTLKEVVTEPIDGYPDEAKLTVKLIARTDAAESVGFDPVAMKLVVDGFDVPLDWDSLDSFAPGTNARVSYSENVNLADIALIESGVLVVGREDSNQAVVPLVPGPSADAVRHPEIVQQVSFGDAKPDARAGTVTLSFDQVSFGASSRSAKPAAAGTITVGVRFRMCVASLDQEIGIRFADSDGITTDAHTSIYTPSGGTGLIVTEGNGFLSGVKCPATEQFESFTDIPIESQGKTVTMFVTASFDNVPDFMSFPIDVPVIDETAIPE